MSQIGFMCQFDINVRRGRDFGYSCILGILFEVYRNQIEMVFIVPGLILRSLPLVLAT